MKRRNFIRVAGGGLVAAAGGALAAPHLDAMPEEAVAGWKGPPAGEQDPRRRAIAWAILAPNPHNMQPWLVDLRQPDEVTLHVDRTRLLPQTDPFGRQVMIGQGTDAALRERIRAIAPDRPVIFTRPGAGDPDEAGQVWPMEPDQAGLERLVARLRRSN